MRSRGAPIRLGAAMSAAVCGLLAGGTAADRSEGKSGSASVATYSVPGPGKVCFDHVSTGAPPHCWTSHPANADGAWTATLDDGTTLTVTPKG